MIRDFIGAAALFIILYVSLAADFFLTPDGAGFLLPGVGGYYVEIGE